MTATMNDLRRLAKSSGISVPRTVTKAGLLLILNGTPSKPPADITRALRVCHRESPNAAKKVRAYIDGLLNGTLS